MKSAAKKRAARVNGLKGARPRRKEVAAGIRELDSMNPHVPNKNVDVWRTRLTRHLFEILESFLSVQPAEHKKSMNSECPY